MHEWCELLLNGWNFGPSAEAQNVSDLAWLRGPDFDQHQFHGLWKRFQLTGELPDDHGPSQRLILKLQAALTAIEQDGST